MSPRILYYFILALGATLISESFSAASQAGENTEWVFQQNHFDNGRNRIYLSKNAVKIVSLSGGFQILAKAPSWRVIIFRPDDKTMYVTDMHELRRFSPFGPLSRQGPQEIPLIKLESNKQNDFVITTYKTMVPFRKVSLADGPVSHEAQEIVRTYYRILDGSVEPGIPLKYTVHVEASKVKKGAWFNEGAQSDSENKDWLSTDSWKMVAFSAEDFENPEAYKTVPTMSDILVSRAKRQNLDSLIDGLGIGPK